MSTIVTPLPPLDDEEKARALRKKFHEEGAFWWRLRLLPNEDGNFYTITKDRADPSGWMSWEFYDGHRTYIDCGLDSATFVVLYNGVSRTYLDIVSVSPPTPCPRWKVLGEVDPDPWVFPDQPDDLLKRPRMVW